MDYGSIAIQYSNTTNDHRNKHNDNIRIIPNSMTRGYLTECRAEHRNNANSTADCMDDNTPHSIIHITNLSTATIYALLVGALLGPTTTLNDSFPKVITDKMDAYNRRKREDKKRSW